MFIIDNREYREIYLTVCADLAEGLENCTTDESRRKEIEDFLARWSRFFERYGDETLSLERQRGLLGELMWMVHILQAGIEPEICIKSWKGCERGFHDFDIAGNVVEVKTTMMKEPRKVYINNERQLDDTGLKSLYLFVVSLSTVDGHGQSLPDIVTTLRRAFKERSSLKYSFEHALRESGYLDIHAHHYRQRYALKKEELFSVEEGFPRIIAVPAGLGNIRYSLLVSSCHDYACHMSDYMRIVREAAGNAK